MLNYVIKAGWQQDDKGSKYKRTQVKPGHSCHTATVLKVSLGPGADFNVPLSHFWVVTHQLLKTMVQSGRPSRGVWICIESLHLWKTACSLHHFLPDKSSLYALQSAFTSAGGGQTFKRYWYYPFDSFLKEAIFCWCSLSLLIASVIYVRVYWTELL